MTKQFKRRVSLVVATDAEGLDLSELHIQFSVKQWDIQTPNTARVRVWNLSEQTANTVQKEFTRVVLQCGYEGGPLGKIFDGTIIQAKTGKSSATDSYLDIVAADGDQAYSFAVVNTSLAAGATATDQAKAAIGAMSEYDVSEGYMPEDMGDAALPRGVVMFGMARDHLNDISDATDTKWSIQNGEAQIIPLTGALPNTAVVLNSTSGLIGRPEQTQDGIKVRCLLNPEIRMGGRVQIDNASINRAAFQTTLQGEVNNALLPRVADDGFYRVIVADHVGDTRGNDWYSDLICIALDDGVTPGLVAKGYG